MSSGATSTIFHRQYGQPLPRRCRTAPDDTPPGKTPPDAEPSVIAAIAPPAARPVDELSLWPVIEEMGPAKLGTSRRSCCSSAFSTVPRVLSFVGDRWSEAPHWAQKVSPSSVSNLQLVQLPMSPRPPPTGSGADTRSAAPLQRA